MLFQRFRDFKKVEKYWSKVMFKDAKFKKIFETPLAPIIVMPFSNRAMVLTSQIP